jgi:hypothetical protein
MQRVGVGLSKPENIVSVWHLAGGADDCAGAGLSVAKGMLPGSSWVRYGSRSDQFIFATTSRSPGSEMGGFGLVREGF